MHQYKRAGLLIILLVIPALVFLFLKGYGKNHYQLPRYIPLLDSATGNIRMQTVEVDGKRITDTAFHQIAPFTLTNQQNQLVGSGTVKGKIHVADFFFARCPGICPKMSSQLQRVQDTFMEDPEVLILSFSVDPEHDSVEALHQYAEQYGVKPDKWHLLTGDKATIYQLAKTSYFVTAKEDNMRSADLEDQFVHTDKFVLVDPKGVIRGFYNGTDPEEVDKLILEIKILQYEDKITKK
jgi:protein SCO1/2